MNGGYQTGNRQIVSRFEVPAATLPVTEPPGACCRYHGGIVGVEPRGSYAHPCHSRQPLFELCNQAPVARHPASDHRLAITARFNGMCRLGHQDLDRCILEGACKVRAPVSRGPRLACRVILSHFSQHCGLQAADGERVPIRPLSFELPEHWAWQSDLTRSPTPRESLEGATAGITKTQEISDLVERLSRGIVQRLSKKVVLTPSGHIEKHRMTATHQQSNERRFQQRIFQSWREQVSFQMIHADERQATAESQRLAVHDANQQGTDKARPCRDGNTVQLGEADPSVGECLFHYGTDSLHVGSTGELGNNSAEYSM